MNSKEKTLMAVTLKSEGLYMYMDSELPSTGKEETYYRVMEQFDITEDKAREVVSKFKELALDIERIVGI